jgi:hypothetical protein
MEGVVVGQEQKDKRGVGGRTIVQKHSDNFLKKMSRAARRRLG